MASRLAGKAARSAEKRLAELMAKTYKKEDQSSLAPEALTTWPHFFNSALMKASNCAPVRLGNSAPCPPHTALASSVWQARRIYSTARLWASAGVPLGAHTPYQVETL